MGRDSSIRDRSLALRGGAEPKKKRRKKSSKSLHPRGTNASPWVRFVQIFVPSYKQPKIHGDKQFADFVQPGFTKRCSLFVKSLLSSESSSASTKASTKPSSQSTDTDSASNSDKSKSSGSASASASASVHLETKYRPGNLNYRLQKELKEFMTSPPDNCQVAVGKSLKVWIVTITGAEGTIYAGETFKLRVSFPDQYPVRPPSVYFLQSPPPPKHEHVYTNGDICLSLLGQDWKPNLTVSSLALSILSMLSSAKDKRQPVDNHAHAMAKPGQAQDNWVYHDANA